MKFSINPKIIDLFPNVKIGLLIIKNIRLHFGEANPSSLLSQAEEGVRKSHTLDELATLPKIVDWREAYQKFGFKPSSHRSSVEALLRRILQGKGLPTINPIVDLYNLVSIKHILPVGGDDLDHVEGDILLTIADGTEKFIMLGALEPEGIKKGEVVYRDEKEVLCRSWNYRECEKTKITINTKNVCLVLEGLEHTSKEEILKAIAELRTLFLQFSNAEFQEFFLHAGQREAIF